MTHVAGPAGVLESAPGESTAIRVVRDRAGFDSLREAWEAIVDGHRAHQRVFGSHAWFDAVLQWQSDDTHLELVCYAPTGRLAAVLPLARRSHRVRGVPVRELAFLAVPDTQWCDIVGVEARSDAASEALADALEALAPWDVLRLGWLASDSAVLSSLAPVLERRGFRTAALIATRNPTVALSSSWDAYLGSRSRRLKKALNLANNRLRKAGAIEIARTVPGAASHADVERLLAQAIAISQASWKRTTGNALDRPGPLAFIRRLTEHAHARGWLSLWTLSLDGRPLACEYQLVADGSVYALRSDFDAAFEDISPGSHLNRVLLESLFGTGLARYFMGPGENVYKLRWRDSDEPVHMLIVYGKTLRGRLLATWDMRLRPLARRLRDRIAPPPGDAAPAGERDD